MLRCHGKKMVDFMFVCRHHPDIILLKILKEIILTCQLPPIYLAQGTPLQDHQAYNTDTGLMVNTLLHRHFTTPAW